MGKFRPALFPVLCVLISFGVGCKKGGEPVTAERAGANPPADNYASVRETVTQYVGLLETCAKEVEAATEANGIAAALNKMNDGMLSVAPKIKILSDNFPELNNPANMSADLKPVMDKMYAIQPIMMSAMRKANQFAAEPIVQAALGRFSEIQKMMQ